MCLLVVAEVYESIIALYYDQVFSLSLCLFHQYGNTDHHIVKVHGAVKIATYLTFLAPVYHCHEVSPMITVTQTPKP